MFWSFVCLYSFQCTQVNFCHAWKKNFEGLWSFVNSKNVKFVVINWRVSKLCQFVVELFFSNSCCWTAFNALILSVAWQAAHVDCMNVTAAFLAHSNSIVGSVLSSSQEYCHCHRRDVALKPQGKAAHPTIALFLTCIGSILSASQEHCHPSVLWHCWLPQLIPRLHFSEVIQAKPCVRVSLCVSWFL